MRLARHETADGPRIASVVEEDGSDILVDLDVAHTDLPALLGDLGADSGALETVATGHRTALADAKLLSPVGAPPAILAIGLNYRAHAEEGG